MMFTLAALTVIPFAALLVLAAPLGALTTFLLASPLTPSPDNLSSFSELLLKTIQDRNWVLLVALVLTAAVWGLRKFGGTYIPWLKTDRGGAVLVLVLGFLGVVTTALASGATLSFSLVLTAVSTALTAAGGFNILKKLLFPSDAAAVPAGSVNTESVLDK